MKDKQIIDDLKEMIYKLQIECVEKTNNILALGDQLKTAETVIEILEAKIGGHEYAISDIVKEYQGKFDSKEQEYEELKRCYKNNLELLNLEETNTTKLVNKVMKLEQTLAEIKEIAKKGYESSQITKLILDLILQKINEVENDNTRNI